MYSIFGRKSDVFDCNIFVPMLVSRTDSSMALKPSGLNLKSISIINRIICGFPFRQKLYCVNGQTRRLVYAI